MVNFAIVMNRRHFCKIASLTVAALSAGARPALASEVGDTTDINDSSLPRHHRLREACRLTVLRRECHLDLQALYLDDPDAGPCRLFRAGDEMTFEAGASCPLDFCPKLWEMICAAVGSTPCTAGRIPLTTILACPDGTRPVIVRVDVSA